MESIKPINIRSLRVEYYSAENIYQLRAKADNGIFTGEINREQGEEIIMGLPDMYLGRVEIWEKEKS